MGFFPEERRFRRASVEIGLIGLNKNLHSSTNSEALIVCGHVRQSHGYIGCTSSVRNMVTASFQSWVVLWGGG